MLLGACASTVDDSDGADAVGASAATTAADTTAIVTSAGGDADSRVVAVTDGDTVDVVVGGREDTVRLIGINSPESGECFADEAASALVDLVDGVAVRLVPDVTDRDQYDRLLRYLYVGDTFVNEALVRGGFAQAYRYEPDVAEADRLDAAQAAAERDQVGLWAPDACGREVPGAGALAIDRIEADPPGDDTDDPNAEFVVVRNGGSDTLDLGGWGLKDLTATHRFDFPAGFVLAPGAAVTIHTGCGNATATDLFWCNQGSAVWNNDGDTAFLLDPNGNVVDTLTY